MTLQAYLALNFLVEAIQRAKTVEGDAVAKALRGLVIPTPLGRLTLRADAHEVGRGLFIGRVVEDARRVRILAPNAVYVNDAL